MACDEEILCLKKAVGTRASFSSQALSGCPSLGILVLMTSHAVNENVEILAYSV